MKAKKQKRTDVRRDSWGHFEEFWRDLGYTDIHKASAYVGVDDRKPALRLYCTSAGEAWNLQTRGPLRLKRGRTGADFIIASTSLSREDLLALREAIDAALEKP